MTIMTLSTAIERVRRTYPDSPLAIFVKYDEINVVFANTVHTQKLINESIKSYIGTFSKADDLNKLKTKLKNITENYA